MGLAFYNEEVDLVKNNRDNDFNDNKLTNLDSITFNRNPSLDNELANKKYVDDSLGRDSILRFLHALENSLKVSNGKDIYILSKYDKVQITDTTIIRAPNNGGYLLRNWVMIKLIMVKYQTLIKKTKTNPPTGDSGATSSPATGDSFMYIETTSNNNGDNVFCSFERTDNIQISNITFSYNRFSAGSTKSRGRFRVQLSIKNNTWSVQYNISKRDRYSDTLREWTLVNLNFTVENYSIKLIYDGINGAQAYMCFSIITITHSVY